LLSHGAAFLFLLWYITPRTKLQQESSKEQPSLVPREARTAYAGA